MALAKSDEIAAAGETDAVENRDLDGTSGSKAKPRVKRKRKSKAKSKSKPRPKLKLKPKAKPSAKRGPRLALVGGDNPKLRPWRKSDWTASKAKEFVSILAETCTGDGVTDRFELIKTYGTGEIRRITRPVAGSVRVSVSGTETSAGWTLEDKGVIQFATAPANGAAINAGFQFDTPVRFAEDRIEINRATFLAGEAPSVPLTEVREG